MKRRISIVLAIVMAVGSVFALGNEPVALADEGDLQASPSSTPTLDIDTWQTDGDFMYNLYDYESGYTGEARITRYTGNAAELNIPATLGGYPVTKISNGAFYECTSLKSVVIPNGVLIIGDHPHVIGGLGAFEACTSLTSVTIPDSIHAIYNDTFMGCSALTSLTIPNNVHDIGFDGTIFDGCTSLSSITVDVGNQNYATVNGVLFNKKQSVLIQYPAAKKDAAYNVPNTVTDITDKAFMDCKDLTSVTIPGSVTTIWRQSFLNCKVLANVTMANGVAEIQTDAFRGCKALTGIAIPTSVNSISESTFWGCYKLTFYVAENSYAHKFAVENNITFSFKTPPWQNQNPVKTPNPKTKAVPKSKTVKKFTRIKLKAPKDTTLYYTTNGKKPTLKTKKKVKPGKTKSLLIKKVTRLKVIAQKKGCTASSVVTRKYKIRKR